MLLYTTLWNVNVSKTSHYNDKLQGNVATYLRCGGIVHNQIWKGLLLSLSVKFFSKSVNEQLYLSASDGEKKTNKKQYTINTEIQSIIDMQDYQAVTCV